MIWSGTGKFPISLHTFCCPFSTFRKKSDNAVDSPVNTTLMFSIKTNNLTWFHRYDDLRVALTICDLEPWRTARKIWRQSSAINTAIPPKRQLLPRMSWSVLSMTSKIYLWPIDTSPITKRSVCGSNELVVSRGLMPHIGCSFTHIETSHLVRNVLPCWNAG